jgi:hypothetical protein
MARPPAVTTRLGTYRNFDLKNPSATGRWEYVECFLRRNVILSWPEKREHNGAMEMTLFMFLKKLQLSFMKTETSISL